MQPVSTAASVDAAPFTIPPFARACIEAAAGAWRASFDHPFVRALAEGTLDAERFRFYQMQDARYLEAFADAASLISIRCTVPADKLDRKSTRLNSSHVAISYAVSCLK